MSARAAVTLIELKGRSDSMKWAVSFPEAGKRRRKYFRTRPEARVFKQRQEIALRNHGTRAATATQEEQAAMVEFRDEIAALGLSPREFVERA